MSIDRRKFLAMVGVAGGALAGRYAVMTQEDHDPSSPGDDGDESTTPPAGGNVLHIPSGTEHVVTGREQQYRQLRWEPEGTLVFEPNASLAFVDTLES